jgi:transcriptional regulator with XRE-family HTH domain
MEATDAAMVGRRLRELREQRKPPITAAELARRVGLSKSHVSKVEKGERRATPEYLRAVAPVLHVPEQQLYALAGYQYVQPGEEVMVAADNPLEAALQAISRFGWKAESVSALSELLTHTAQAHLTHAAFAARFDRAISVLWPEHGETPLDPTTDEPLSEARRLGLLRDWVIEGREAAVRTRLPNY